MTRFTPENVHVHFTNAVAVYMQGAWTLTTDLTLRPQDVGFRDEQWVLLAHGGQLLMVPQDEAIVSTTVRDTYPIDGVSANGVIFAAKTVLGAMDACRALEGLGDLSTLLAEAHEARSNEAALGFAIV